MKRKRTAVDDAALPAPTGTALSLTIVGALMIITTFALLNEWFGVHIRQWPWDFVTDGDQSLRIRTLYGLSFLTALWALGLSFARSHRLRSFVLVALTAVLFVECTRALSALRLDPVGLGTLVPLTTLGAGLLMAREDGTRGTGRVLAGVAAVAFVWTLAATFKGNVSLLEQWWTDITCDLGEHPGNHLWSDVLPRSIFLVAAAFGMLAALGMTHRLLLLIVFWLVGAGLLVPVGIALIEGIDAGSGAQALTDGAVTALVSQGFLLWLLGAFALFDTGRGRMRES